MSDSLKKSLKKLIMYVKEVGKARDINIHRGFSDFLADKIKQASTEKNLFLFFEKLCLLLNSNIDFIHNNVLVDFVSIPEIEKKLLLRWIRSNYKLCAMLSNLKDENGDINVILENVEIDESSFGDKFAEQNLFQSYDVPILVKTQAPLAHGADTKSGNATLFRRMQVISSNGNIITLPFYAGNAFRGKMRDLLADHFLKSLDIDLKKPNSLALWFFHVLFAGGCLEENSKHAKAIGEKLGNNGASKAIGITEFRNIFASLSLLGTALGNRVISGRICVSDLKPKCIEWGNGTQDSESLFEWLYLTRREDNEGHQQNENSSMIANTECLKAGTVLEGGIDFHPQIIDLEKACLLKGLELMKDYGFLGAESRRGFGKVIIDFSLKGIESSLYSDHLKENKEKIIAYMDEIGCFSKEEKDIEKIEKGKRNKKEKKVNDILDSLFPLNT